MPAHYLRHYWSDNAGLYRAKVEVDGRATGSGVGLAHADQAQCAMHRDLAPGAGIGALGDLKLVPDSATWVPLPHRERTFRVFGDMYENGAAWPLCPRAFLKAAVAEASSMGYRIRAAFEPEFYLLKRRGKIVHPMDDGAYGDAPLLDALDAWMDASLTSLEVQKVMAEGFHHESGPGQYEISIRPSEPVKAADDIITLRDTIQGISRDFGRTATFCPKPFPNLPGSGLHLNLSFWKDGVSCMASPEDPQALSRESHHFIAGVLHGLDAAIALTCPSWNSHRRLIRGHWSGSSRYWQYADREAVIRVPRSGNAPITHVEFRALDSTANPYLALGAILQLGLDGLRRQLETLAPPQVAAPLPTFHDAMKSLGEHALLAQKLGPRLLQAYLAVRRSDFEHASQFGPEEEFHRFIEKY